MAKDKNKKSIIAEFREFISRGSVLDMAVGIIIGTAFTAIVNSLVADLFMPVLGMITGKINFSDMKIVMQAEVLNEVKEVITPEVAFRYGIFIEKIINFLLVAVAVFALVKIINTVRDKAEKLAHKKKLEEEAKVEEAPAAPDPQLVLLTEIRDLLKDKE